MQKRYIMPLIVSVIFIIVAVILSFFPLMIKSTVNIDLIPILPGGVISDVIISILIPYVFLIIMLILGPIIAPVFVRLHKLIKLNKYEYFINKSNKKRSGFRILTRAIFPGMLAVNIAIYIALYSDLNALIYYEGADSSKIPIVIEYASIIFGIPIASLIIIPLWMIESSGLISSKKVELYNRPISPDIESVGQFYIKLLKGFIGISFVVSYSLILYEYFIHTSGIEASILLIIFIDPVLIILFSLPIALIIEIRKDKIDKKIIKSLAKLKIDTTPKKINIQ